jgi:hypothetical protein
VIVLTLIALLTVIAGPAGATPGNGNGQTTLISVTCGNHPKGIDIVVANGQWASAYVVDDGRAIPKRLQVLNADNDVVYEIAKPNWEKQSNDLCSGSLPADWGDGYFYFYVWVDLK